MYPRFIALVAVLCVSASRGADAPPPASPGPARTGELDLTFTQRSPISSRQELARRLNLKESEMGEDYDVVKRPFKAYIPTNYDPGTSVGIFVYLGYKDAVSVAPLWEPALDKFHMIFITPVCHHGDKYPNQVPAWQTTGLALDAVENLKHLYKIDEKRIYLMSWGEGSMQMSLGTSDVFTGLIVVADFAYCQPLMLRDKRFYPPAFPLPPAALFQLAKRRAFVMIHNDFSNEDVPPQLVVITMKRNGFSHVLPEKLGYMDDIHYPMFKVEWFEQTVLPFLDSASAEIKPIESSSPDAKPTTSESKPPKTGDTAAATNTNPPSPVAPPPPSSNKEAQHLLKMAQLYIKNDQKKLARSTLEGLLRRFPSDPAAATAKDLLSQLPEQ